MFSTTCLAFEGFGKSVCANLSEKLLEVDMQTEEENLLVRREIGDAVLAVLEQGKVVSVESLITYLERQHHKVTHMQYQNRYRHAVDLLIKKS